MTQNQHIKNLSALHFNEACSPLLDTLCEPLFENFGVTHFGYIRILEDGKIFRMATNKAWTRTYFQKEFYNCLESDIEIWGLNHVPLNEQRFMILNGPPQNDHFEILYSEFNIWNFMLIHEKSTTHIDFWFFGADRNNTGIINFYINNKHVLQHFIRYVKNKACHLFDMNDSSKLISTNIRFLKESFKEKDNLQKFINELSHNKFYLNGQHNEKFLSKRESEWYPL
jgi:hypothetical protein